MKSQDNCYNNENFDVKREDKIECQNTDTIDSEAASDSKLKLNNKHGELGN